MTCLSQSTGDNHSYLESIATKDVYIFHTKNSIQIECADTAFHHTGQYEIAAYPIRRVLL
jgi:hypothetical protein